MHIGFCRPPPPPPPPPLQFHAKFSDGTTAEQLLEMVRTGCSCLFCSELRSLLCSPSGNERQFTLPRVPERPHPMQFDGWGYTAHTGGFDGPVVPKSQFATVASDPNFLDGSESK